MAYEVKLDKFEGPLDLLLFLIKKNEVDIYDIPIAKITEQYLEYMEVMELLDLDIAGEFLVVAATLMHIKSKMLLPPDETQQAEEEELDPRAELVKRLIEYKAFKEVADKMQGLEAVQRNIFSRPLTDDEIKAECENEHYFEVSLFDLISAFSSVLANIPKEIFFEVIKDEVTVEQKVHDILHILINTASVYLKPLFSKARSKAEMITIFLAVLELVKTQNVLAVQNEIFADIEIMRNEKALNPAK